MIIYYSVSLNQEVDVYLPDNVDLRGECDEDYANLGMTFKSFELIIYFRKVLTCLMSWEISQLDSHHISSHLVSIVSHYRRPEENGGTCRASTWPTPRRIPYLSILIDPSWTCTCRQRTIRRCLRRPLERRTTVTRRRWSCSRRIKVICRDIWRNCTCETWRFRVSCTSRVTSGDQHSSAAQRERIAARPHLWPLDRYWPCAAWE